jgi:glutamate racemase
MTDPQSKPQTDPRPIGMLDSGVGGFAVLREVRAMLPHESIIYVADQGHLPYGPRPRDEIRQFVSAIVKYLIDQNCKLIAIPCNAANAAALHYVREMFPDMPIVGMEPAIKPAAEHTKTGVIGVITTKATYQGELFASVMDRFAQNVKVETQVCPDFVLMVEQGAPDTPESRNVIKNYIAPLQAAGIDQLVIGCTHFTFLESQLKDELGPNVEIVDPAPAVARQVKRVLEQRGLLHAPSGSSTVQYITSGDPDHMRYLIDILLHEATPDVIAARWDRGQLCVDKGVA